MSPCRSIAILGATGNFGEQILAALSQHPRAKSLDIRILTRPSPWQIPVDPSLNISLYQITYNTRGTHAALLDALTGVDVVISAVGDDSGLTSREVKNSGALPGFKAQDQVATAAKAAGVKLFVPS
jgi:putative NADH-flavin reductase